MEDRLERLFDRFRRRGDTAALAEIFDRTAPEILRVAMHLARDPAGAEDLLQATFLTAIEAAERFDAERPILPWLLGILANHARAARRRDLRAHAVQPTPAGGPPDPFEAAARSEFSDEVAKALDDLDEPYRQVLLLKLKHGLDPVEIAHVLSRPPATVRSQAHRGLSMLRRALPVGFLFAAAVPQGLAAVRATVLNKAATLAGVATMSKKTTAVAAVLLLLFTSATVLVATKLRSDNGGDTARSDAGRAATSHPSDAAGGDAEKGRAIERGTGPGGTGNGEAAADDKEAAKEKGDHGSLRVQVKWADGKPAKSVGVRVHQWRGKNPYQNVLTQVTDAAGTARFKKVHKGRISVGLDRADPKRADIEAGSETTLEFAIEPGVLVHGVVVDASDAPVPRADIWVSRFGGYAEGLIVDQADEEGRFAVRDLKMGLYVGARGAGYAPSNIWYVLGGEKGKQEMRLVLPGAGGAVRGRVLDPRGDPVAGVQVHVGKKPVFVSRRPGTRIQGWTGPQLFVRTDEDGRFLAEGIAPGKTPVEARIDGFAPWSGEASVVAGNTTDVVVRLEEGAVLVGRILGRDGKPAAGVLVQTGAFAAFRSARTRTRKDGTFRVEALPLGALAVSADAGKRGKAEGKVTLERGRETRWDATLSAGARIVGRVVDGSGNPCVKWWIACEGHAGAGRWYHESVHTDKDGRFVFENCLADVGHNVRIHPPQGGFYAVAYRKGVRPGGEELLVHVAEDQLPTGYVKGVVTKEDGTPLGGAVVSVSHPQSNGTPIITTDVKTGGFRIGPLPPAEYRISIRAEGFPPLPLGKRKIASGQELDLGTLRLETPGWVAAVVHDANGATMADGFVSVEGERGNAWGKIEKGAARAGPLRPGTYKVRVGADGYATHEVDVDVLADRETSVRVTLRRKSE